MRKACKVGAIVREELRDSVGLHRGDHVCVMHDPASHRNMINQMEKTFGYDLCIVSNLEARVE